MAEQTATRPARTSREEETKLSGSALSAKGKELTAAIDNLLDEIDDLLEENAEEFVAGYVQRGGQ